MNASFNKKDQSLWENVFANVPVEWKQHPPTRHMEDCLDFFKKHKVKTVIDAGCGIGRWSIYLASHNFEVFAYDFSGKAIAYASEWARGEKLTVRFKICELTKVPFPDKKFDAYLAAMVVHNISKEELKRCLDLTYDMLNNWAVAYILVNPFFTKEMEKQFEASNNPTRDITQINYTDDELKTLFSDYTILNFKIYEDGTRGLFMKKPFAE